MIVIGSLIMLTPATDDDVIRYLNIFFNPNGKSYWPVIISVDYMNPVRGDLSEPMFELQYCITNYIFGKKDSKYKLTNWEFELFGYLYKCNYAVIKSPDYRKADLYFDRVRPSFWIYADEFEKAEESNKWERENSYASRISRHRRILQRSA